MRICFICPEYPNGPHGGIGSYTQDIARLLVKFGNEVRVIGVYKRNYRAPLYEEDFGVKVWRLYEKRGKFGWIPAWINQYKIIRKWAINHEIDLIESPDSRGWLAFWGKFPIPVVLRFHGSNTFINLSINGKINVLSSFLGKLSYQRADILVSVSNYNAAKTAEIFNLRKEIKIIHNGIKITPLTNLPRKKDKIVFASSLLISKGIFDLLDALKMLVECGVQFTADIYGKDIQLKDGHWVSESILNLSKTLPISYCGHITRDELFLVYRQATVAVFPSHVESFGLAPVEAMMCECPVIFSNNSTGREIIEDGIDGILIPPHSPREIKNSIIKIFDNFGQAIQMGKKARQNVEKKFNINNLLLKNIALYKDAIKDS